MPSAACLSCRRAFRTRLRSRIFELHQIRRGLHPVSHQRVANWDQSLYLDSFPPNEKQSHAAAFFFKSHPPRIAWVANEWRKQISDPNDTQTAMLTPEIAFLGRSNTGKSSLLNALLGNSTLCRVGPKPGKTIAMHAWALARSDPKTGGAKKGTGGDTDNKLIVLDMPGYGHGSRDEWGNEIVKYLKRRRQLKRAFLLLNPEHGIKESDEQILQLLRASGIAHQIVACKCDKIKMSQLNTLLLGIQQQIQEEQMRQGGLGVALNDILAIGKLGDGKSNKRMSGGSMLGVDEVRWAVLRAVGLEGFAEKKYAENMRKKRAVMEQNGMILEGNSNTEGGG